MRKTGLSRPASTALTSDSVAASLSIPVEPPPLLRLDDEVQQAWQAPGTGAAPTDSDSTEGTIEA